MALKHHVTGVRPFLLAGCLASAASAGCAHLGSHPATLTLQLAGDPKLNVVNGRSNPVQIRVYQLADRGKFDRLAAGALWRADTAALGGDLLKTSELTLVPGSQSTVRLDLAGPARFVAVAGNFYTPDANAWRVVRPSAPRRGLVRVRVSESRISLD